MHPDIFQQAQADAVKAVHLFLPSLRPPSPPGPSQPPPPKQLAEPLRVMSMARHVEKMSGRIARGLPPEEPKPTPEQQFGPELDPVHIRALSAAIAAHPETERAQLMHEAHESLIRWIGSHNGRVVVDGHVELAHSPQQAETLAAKIINGAVDDHDQRKQAEAEAALPDNHAGRTDSGGQPKAWDGDPAQQGADVLADPSRLAVPADNPEIVLPGGSGEIETPKGPPPKISPQEVQKVGTRKPDGHQVTQPKNSIDANQKLALQATPELHQALSQLTSQVPGATYARLRPQKADSRLDQKVQDENSPNTLSDYLGAQIAADTPQAKDQLVDLLRKTFKVIEVDDRFLDGRPDKAGYPSANVQVQLSPGNTAEVQIVPREVQAATEDSHKFYKAGRDAEEKGDHGERDRQWKEAEKINQGKLAEFKQRNGIGLNESNALNDPHGPLRQSLDSAGLKPIKLGGKLFYALNPQSEGADNVSAAANPPVPAAPTASAGSGDRATEENVPRPSFSKGQRVSLQDGTEAEVAYADPQMNVVRLKTPSGNRVVHFEDINPNAQPSEV